MPLFFSLRLMVLDLSAALRSGVKKSAWSPEGPYFELNIDQ